MEVGAHVWLRSESSHWGWIPAKITAKEEVSVRSLNVIQLTLSDDTLFEDQKLSTGNDTASPSWRESSFGAYDQLKFQVKVMVDPEQLKTADHDDIKLRNLPSSYHSDEMIKINGGNSLQMDLSENIIGGVDDLIGLTHLHEPAILHALQLRYENDIIYTSTGPILIAVNPFKPMKLYSEVVMEKYRAQGEQGLGGGATNGNLASEAETPFKRRTNDALMKKIVTAEGKMRLPPHVYQTADNAYRAMMRGVENRTLMNGGSRSNRSAPVRPKAEPISISSDQSILVSGESGAGKTVTTKFVLNYFAMLSKKASEANAKSSNFLSPVKARTVGCSDVVDFSIERQVLHSNPILESFGNARTMRNDNSSRFGKYIDIRFNSKGQLAGACIETYLLEKVRLIHPSEGERNYHVFYQFLSSADAKDRDQFYLDDFQPEDFKLLNQTGTYDRRDGVKDTDNHLEMLDAMNVIGFQADMIQSFMRIITAILFAGNMTFSSRREETCVLEETHASLASAALLGVSFADLASAITSRTINTGREIIEKQLSVEQAVKASEAIIKAIYGALFDYIVEKINDSIKQSNREGRSDGVASIGVLDIFGFETFKYNNFEQLCINYTNEALQQQFNRYVFKLEQLEYEKEGILWKYISFPDNQDVLDLIDKKHVGILPILDEQCIVPQSTDQKFTRFLYTKCDGHNRFIASSAQRVDYKFSIIHYAGHVEYSTDSWLEKNKDQLPAKCSALLNSSSFMLLTTIQKYIRTESREGRGSVVQKSVGAQFAQQLKSLRDRIEETTPHYIRCLKPNDELVPDYFEPKNIVEQLRCGGVLEAVRVSRAGYPTRYPHDVFLARYYILGEKMINKINKEEALRQLVDKVAFDMWLADQQLIQYMLEAERLQEEMSSPRYAHKSDITTRPVFVKGNTIVNGPQSLAVQSSAQTPLERKNFSRKQKLTRLSLHSMKERTGYNQIARPESENEFLTQDFATRCALSGIQLGRTKVFLRREAFDRIEAMRSQMFFGSASKIQAMIRGKLYREQYKRMRIAAIKIQSMVRVMVSKDRVHAVRVNNALYRSSVVVLQRWFRRLSSKKHSSDRAYCAARVIQARARGVIYRNRYYSSLFGIIQLQALSRGRRIRRHIVNAKSKASIERYLSSTLANVASMHSGREITPRRMEVQVAPFTSSSQIVPKSNELFRFIQEENWAMVEQLLDKKPELAEEIEFSSGELPLHVIARHKSAWTLLIDMILVLYPKALIHRDKMGALPIHHASAHDNLAALEIIYSAYKDGINDVDGKGRMPLHVAAEFDAVDAVKFLLSKNSEAAFTMVYRPVEGDGGGLPLHVACRNYASIGVITALLAENFASGKRTDENGDLPLHLILRCGEVVDHVVVKTLLTCFAGAASRTDMYGDLPLCIALKHQCKPAVVNSVLMHFPTAASVQNSDGHTPLHLAFQHGADDRTILALLNHAPELATTVDKATGLLPIQVATANDHSHFIVHNLLKRDMPIDLNEKIRAHLLPHQFSWNHIVSNTDDMYHEVVSKILQVCTQPQVLALAHVEGPDGKIALASATPVCKYEMRVMLRLFNTLEVVNQKPAYTNPTSDTQIFYALRYDPPPTVQNAFTILHEEKHDRALSDYVEDFDDNSVTSGMSKMSFRSTVSSSSKASIADRLRHIRKEKGQQVIAKLTSRSDVVERELRVRKDFQLSRNYVPAVISVHHTVQHAAYSEAMAEPGYCITMEGADTTAENLMLDLRKAGKPFPIKALKRIGIALLHMHEHGLVHCDFGTHNIGKFGNRWKMLGVGGSVAIGKPTDPNRGFYHPPESILVEAKRSSLGKKAFSSCVVSLSACPTYDIWAYGVLLYEAISGAPLSAYACRGKRAMSSAEIAKIGQWDDHSLKKALKSLPEDEENARDLLELILQAEPEKRINTMRHVLEHPFFANTNSSESAPVQTDTFVNNSSSFHSISTRVNSSDSNPKDNTFSSQNSNQFENRMNGTRRPFTDENVNDRSAVLLQQRSRSSPHVSTSSKQLTYNNNGSENGGSPSSKKGLFSFRSKVKSSRAQV